jgi:hypothetical protein
MASFDPTNALQTFRSFLKARALNESTLSLREGFEAMLDFYRDERAGGCAGEDADMLLFQWGTYDRAFLPRAGEETGEAFDIDITRQLIAEGGEDDDIWQLSLTFTFEPTAQLRSLGMGNRWCHSLQELSGFRDYVLGSPSFMACSGLRIRRTALAYECAG